MLANEDVMSHLGMLNELCLRSAGNQKQGQGRPVFLATLSVTLTAQIISISCLFPFFQNKLKLTATAATVLIFKYGITIDTCSSRLHTEEFHVQFRNTLVPPPSPHISVSDCNTSYL